jgi:WD40 repeat protein
MSVSIWGLAEDQMWCSDGFIHSDATANGFPDENKPDPSRFLDVTAIAMSPDEKLIALLSADSTIWIYPVAIKRGRKLSTWANAGLTSLRFTSDGQFLETNRGFVSLQPDTNSSGSLLSDSVWGSTSAYLGEEWMVRDGRKLLWFPPDYRSHCVAYHEGTFAFGCASGEVKFIQVQFS